MFVFFASARVEKKLSKTDEMPPLIQIAQIKAKEKPSLLLTVQYTPSHFEVKELVFFPCLYCLYAVCDAN